MPDGGIITITLRNQKPGTAPEELSRMINYINLNFKDMGKGIPEENRKRIFDPFFTTKKKGKGLGLATAYSIITRHKGHINFTSIEGKGTAFDIYLPASRSKSVIEEERAVEIPGSGKILLMDDEETILEAMTETLEHLGYSVIPCMNGEEAFHKYKNAKESNEPFDAVILDLTIPGGAGGKRTMQKILQFDPSAKGIVSSGYAGNQIISKYKDYGFSGAITKPFTISVLSEILKKVLKK
jgi:CheY-like chemotaxis protein